MDRKNTCAFTLRITPELDEQITEAAYDRRMSKASWIRMAIRQCLRLAGALEKKQ
jgi:predicted HicB family RNase H-like nuclease